MTQLNFLLPVHFAEIAGWSEDDHAKALAAFRLSAQEILSKGHGFQRASLCGGRRQEWFDVCRKALEEVQAKSFFENEFQPIILKAQAESLFTGYYEPQALGSLTPTAEFNVPLYARPDDLIAFDKVQKQRTGLSYGHKSAKPYFARREIEQGAINHRGLEICYLSSWVDAFFIHIQGNGRVLLPDGTALRLSFSAKNGLAYKSIGRVLLDRGIGTPATMSMQFLRGWMSQNFEEAKVLMWENPSFVFFSATNEIDPTQGAIGAAKVPLTPLRSLAVDRSFWSFGTPLFLSTHQPPEAGNASFQHLMIAQDTGSAIKGSMRGDIYWGWGAEAELNAGHMKQPGQLIALLPKPLAERLLA